MKKIKMILVFLQVFITPRYKERGFLVSIVKIPWNQKKSREIFGGIFQEKIVLFSISSREELSLKALKTSQRLALLIASYFSSSEYSCPSAYNEDPATRLSLPRGEEFFRAQDLSDCIRRKGEYFVSGGEGGGGNTY